jgi:hypothetical protein
MRRAAGSAARCRIITTAPACRASISQRRWLVVVMARRKDLVPHVECVTAFIPKLGHFDQLINGCSTPKLLADWESEIVAPVGGPFSREQLAHLRSILQRYVMTRFARQKGLGWQEVIARIDGLNKAAEALLSELNNWQHGYNLIWDELSKAAQLAGLASYSHDDVYPMASGLAAVSSRAASNMRLMRRQGAILSHTEPFDLLVNAMKEFWEGAGGQTPVSKSGRDGYAKPTPFVKFVHLAMTNAVPAYLREHTASSGAMQTAISNVLGRTRRMSGRFRKNSA